MSRLEDLLAEYCPVGLEFKKISEVYSRLKGTPITAGKMKEIANSDGEIRIFAGGKTVIDAQESKIPNANITRVPAVLVQSRGIIDFIYYDQPFTFKNEMWAYTCDKPKSVKYLYYVLKNSQQYFIDASSGMGSMPQISLPVTEDFVIPLPPLPVQEEIVRILDKFTALEAELEAELEARKSQYEYYRDDLFLFDKKVTYVELGKMAKIGDGLHGTPDYTDTGEYYFINGNNLNNGEITLYSKTKKVDYNTFIKYGNAFSIDKTILMSINGTIGSVSLYNNEKIVLGKSVAYFNIISNMLSTKYLFYLLQTSYSKDYFSKTLTGSTIKNLGLKSLREFTIPLPPLAEQERIVSILDRFDALVNDITQGLPAEIEARRKQYEYYRNQLLTFKEATPWVRANITL